MAQPLNKHQITFQEHNRLNSVYAIDGMSLNQPANQIDFNTFDHRRDARLECVVAFSIHAIILVCNLTCSIESTTLLAQCFSLPFMLYDFSPCSSILAKKNLHFTFKDGCISNAFVRYHFWILFTSLFSFCSEPVFFHQILSSIQYQKSAHVA